MMLSSSVLREWSNNDCERCGATERPPIFFVPDYELKEDRDKLSVVLHVLDESMDEKDKAHQNRIMVKIDRFSTGTIERMICLCMSVDMVLRLKPCKTAKSKFDMVKLLLDGDGLYTWQTLKDKYTAPQNNSTKTVSLDPPKAPMITDGTFLATCKT